MMSTRNLKNPKGNGYISDYLGEDTVGAIRRVNGYGSDKIGATYGDATAKEWGKFSRKTGDYKQLLSDIRDYLESKGYQDMQDLVEEPF
jgi:hypothetical protein